MPTHEMHDRKSSHTPLTNSMSAATSQDISRSAQQAIMLMPVPVSFPLHQVLHPPSLSS